MHRHGSAAELAHILQLLAYIRRSASKRRLSSYCMKSYTTQNTQSKSVRFIYFIYTPAAWKNDQQRVGSRNTMYFGFVVAELRASESHLV